MKKSFLLLFLICTGALITQAQKSEAPLKDYTGVYVFPEGSVVPEVEVILQDSLLMMNATAGNSELVRIEKDLFNVVAFNGTAQFKRDEAGKVIGVHIEAAGYILDGTKKEGQPMTITFRPQIQSFWSIHSIPAHPEKWQVAICLPL